MLRTHNYQLNATTKEHVRKTLDNNVSLFNGSQTKFNNKGTKILFQVTENILLPNLIEANSEQRNDASVTHQKP